MIHSLLPTAYTQSLFFFFLIFQYLRLFFDECVHKTSPSYFIVSLKLLQFIYCGVNLHIGRSSSVLRPSLRKPSPVIWSERQSHERRNTMKAEKEEDTIPFVPEVYRMPFFLWKWQAGWLQALRFSCYRPASRCITDSETQLSSGVPSLTWKPGFEKMVRVGREKNSSSVFFLIDPVARLLGKPK